MHFISIVMAAPPQIISFRSQRLGTHEAERTLDCYITGSSLPLAQGTRNAAPVYFSSGTGLRLQHSRLEEVQHLRLEASRQPPSIVQNSTCLLASPRPVLSSQEKRKQTNALEAEGSHGRPQNLAAPE